MELVAKPFTVLLDTIIGFFQQIIAWLNPFSEDFILKDPIGFLQDIVAWLNPFSDKFMLKPITDLVVERFATLFSYFNPNHENFILKKVIEFLTNLVDYINPFSDNFLLKIAFVPSDGYFSENFSELQKIIFDKFPFIEQLAAVINPSTLELSMYSDDLDPQLSAIISKTTDDQLSVTMPKKYGGGTYTWMDFSYFMQYRDTIFSVIRLCLWFPFLKWLYGRVPTLINGGMGMDYRQQNTSLAYDKNTGEEYLRRSKY